MSGHVLLLIDIGGTAIKHGLCREPDGVPGQSILHGAEDSGVLIRTGKVPTPAGGPAILDKILAIIEAYVQELDSGAYEALSASDITGVAISTAGIVDVQEGVIRYAGPTIPDYTGCRIRETVEKRFGFACEVENDVNCAGLAEYTYGAARGASSTVCLTIGTGIGGCAIVDGRVLRGATGAACEVGYITIDGKSFEAAGSASALVRKVEDAKHLPAGSLTGEDIFAAADHGDVLCVEAIDAMCDVLGCGIAQLCYILNPEVVVLGGGVLARADVLLPRIRRSMDARLIPLIADSTRLAAASYGNKAGMMGARIHFYQMRERR